MRVVSRSIIPHALKKKKRVIVAVAEAQTTIGN
jgi:hypothetical protein